MITKHSISRSILTAVAVAGTALAAWHVPALAGGSPTPSVASRFGGKANVPGSVAPSVLTAHRLSRIPGSRTVSVSVSLAVRDSAALDAFLSSVYDPASPNYHHFLTTAEFAQRFGPVTSTQSSVMSWLRSQGLAVSGVSANGLQVMATGTASKLSSAFGTPVYSFQQGSRTFIANAAPIQVPASLASDIVAVSGLSTSVQQHPAPVAHLSPAARFTGNSPSDTHAQYDLNPLYGRGINGSGQVVAIASFADYADANVQTFDQQFGLPDANVTRVKVTAGNSTGSPLGVNNGEDEAEMDIEMVHATAPNAGILMYEAPNSDQGATALWNRIVSDNRAKVVTTSWGGPEALFPTSELNAIHSLLQEAAAQGQAIFAASGDAGAYDETGVRHGNPNALVVDYPASDPYVTGVGGTTLGANGSQYQGETAWSDSSTTTGPAGSGGGLSKRFARPSWQTGAGVNNQYSNGKRQVPDVAANADPSTGYSVYTIASRTGSSWGVVGGTSAASPLWAGFAALVNQSMGHPVGFFNPTLYRLGQLSASLPRAPYHDVTEGDNLHYPATPGWDFATGWGSFDADAFVSDLSSVGTAPPTTTPAPTATPAPSISVSQFVLLHTVNGKLTKTRSLKVGETGTIVILYKSKNKGTLQTSGTVQIKQAGKVVKTITLKAGTYGGKPALTATVRFTSTLRVGTLLANATVRLGSLTSGLGYTFSLKP